MAAEHDGLAAVARPGQLGEDESHHEGLDDAAEHGLQEGEVRLVACRAACSACKETVIMAVMHSVVVWRLP